MSKLKAFLSCAVFTFLVCFFSVVAFAASQQTGKVSCSVLNVRQSASTGASVTGQIKKGTAVTILGSASGWYRISYEGGKTGWVCDDYITLDSAVAGQGVITGNVVNLRCGPGTAYGILTTMSKGEKAGVFGKYGEWYRIKTSNGTVGWVINDYFSITSSASRGGAAGIPTIQPSVETSAGTTIQQNVVNYAKAFLGFRYVAAGQSPSGFDCSGFTRYVFSHFGINLIHYAADQAKQGTAVSKAQLMVGDLVFFATGGGSYISHVGIYTGGGNFIHAANPRYGVTITNLTGGYYANTYVTARRIVH